ncbi:MAG: 50S ribosomal protein L10 [Phycisphaeraceae bacterium]|nr:50S ribosomal protein L10 [Phycisphaeraceae bacterium]
MSKPVKDMIVSEYRKRFEGIDGAVVLDIRGIDANQNNGLRLALQKKSVRVTVVKNSLARTAFSGSGLDALGTALKGPSALAFGGDSVVDVARAIIEWAKKLQGIAVKGAVLDGEYFPGEAGVRRLASFPTREEAQAKVVQIALSPARRVVGAAMGPGGRVLGIVRQIEEKLEKNEAIARVG